MSYYAVDMELRQMKDLPLNIDLKEDFVMILLLSF